MRATLGRSVRLFRAFLVEQTEPDRFYRELALDSARLLQAYTPLDGKSLLDVGGLCAVLTEQLRMLAFDLLQKLRRAGLLLGQWTRNRGKGANETDQELTLKHSRATPLILCGGHNGRNRNQTQRRKGARTKTNQKAKGKRQK